MFDIKESLRNLPDKPGVYLHKDKEGNVIYVGKAVSLKNRVRQYFRSLTGADPKVKAMVSHIAEFEYIVTNTEMEALILECNLIKRHMPKYNVLLRDDKTFPYIKLTLNEKWPRLIKTRRVLEDGSKYFGPYTDASALNQIIDLLSDIYSLKRCSTQNFTNDWKPCLNYHIEQCRGLCSGETNWDEYMQSVEQVINFLSGDTKVTIDHLRKRMKEEAEALNFEQAAEIRDKIIAIEAIPDQERLNAFMFKVKKNRIKVIKHKEKSKEKEQIKINSLKVSWEKVGLYNINRIEAYDISHIAGTDSVGAMVVFENGKPQRKEYRRFRIKNASGSGDTDSLKEVMYRRMKRFIAQDPGFSILPDILLIDGGKDQVNAVKQVLVELEIEVPVIGMIKDEKHRTRGIILTGKEMDLKENRTLYRYVTRIQDEVHRFAIEYHRNLREKRLQKSILDDIIGVGPKRKKILLSYYGSIEAIREADVEDMRSIPGMNYTVAKKVKEHLNNSVVKNKL